MKIEIEYSPLMNHNVTAKKSGDFSRQEITVWHFMSFL